MYNSYNNPIQQLLIVLLPATLFITGCGNNKTAKPPQEVVIVQKPEELDIKVAESMQEQLAYLLANNGRLNDTTFLLQPQLLKEIYEAKNNETIWSTKENFNSIADSMFYIIQHAKEYGLFPSDYNYYGLATVRSKMETDSLSKRNAALWTKADILFTDAWLSMAKHLKLGRLKTDSVSLRNDSLATDAMFVTAFNNAVQQQQIISGLQAMEPTIKAYIELRESIKEFIDSASLKRITYLSYPYRDSAKFYNQLKLRLGELGYLTGNKNIDTSAIKQALIKYQKAKSLKPTGKVNDQLVRVMNANDWEKFKRIAVSLDKYKLLGDALPPTYVWVNLPAYTLQVFEDDSLAFESKVIVGSPKNRTPVLNSEITNFITYPQWTVPYSIVFKEMLPQIQRNIGYLNRQNLMVVDKNDSVIDPYNIDWHLLSKAKFPYVIRQRQGDDNSLGVMKFNFKNKYSVYLHDTNARWLFNKSSRAMSHGCVRVQEWEKLSHFLVRNETLNYPPDTLRAWISRQEKHTVAGFEKVPVYLRYITCGVVDGKLKFYDDIYGEDRMLAEKYFSAKPVQ
jgi:L,D-transpeptidase YcbB